MLSPAQHSQFARNTQARNAAAMGGGAARDRRMATGVLHMIADLEIGTVARETVDLAILTYRAGWRPLIASSGGALTLEAERAAVRHSKMPLNRGHLLARWRNRVQLEALTQRERPALIHAHGYAPLAAAHALSVSHRLPLLVDLTEPAAATRQQVKLFKALAARQARFRVPSDFMAERLQQDFGVDGDAIYRIYPGVDMQWYDAVRVTPERLQRLSAAWRLPEHGTVIVMATPLAAGYGHKILLEALAAVKPTDAYVVLIGDDRTEPGARAAIENMVAANGLEGRVVMPEHCADWPAACWLASIVVATNSLPRGQAPELLGAQAIGRPVIVTACGANGEMVVNGETAWVVPPDDRAALERALAEAMPMSAAQRIDLAVRTRDFVAETFPQTVWRDSIFALYGVLLERAATRPPKSAV